MSYGYSNIFVTSPSPENLKTLFQFIFKARCARRRRRGCCASPPPTAGPGCFNRQSCTVQAPALHSRCHDAPRRDTQGFDALGYAEHADYDLVESTNPEFNKARAAPLDGRVALAGWQPIDARLERLLNLMRTRAEL